MPPRTAISTSWVCSLLTHRSTQMHATRTSGRPSLSQYRKSAGIMRTLLADPRVDSTALNAPGNKTSGLAHKLRAAKAAVASSWKALRNEIRSTLEVHPFNPSFIALKVVRLFFWVCSSPPSHGLCVHSVTLYFHTWSFLLDLCL